LNAFLVKRGAESRERGCPRPQQRALQKGVARASCPCPMVSFFGMIFVLLCSVFQMSCIQVDGGFNTGVTAISNQVEDSVSSGMLLTSAYADYFQEFDRWPDSHAKLIEYYKTKAKTDASLIAMYKQLEEFTEVKAVNIEERIIELEFRRPPISPVNDNRSVATGKVIIDAGCP